MTAHSAIFVYTFICNCQALSISLCQSIYLSFSQSLCLRDRDRADTIITFNHTTPPETLTLTHQGTLLKCDTSLESSAQALLISTQKNRVIRVTYDPPVSIRVNKYLKSCSLYLSLSLSFF